MIYLAVNNVVLIIHINYFWLSVNIICYFILPSKLKDSDYVHFIFIPYHSSAKDLFTAVFWEKKTYLESFSFLKLYIFFNFMCLRIEVLDRQRNICPRNQFRVCCRRENRGCWSPYKEMKANIFLELIFYLIGNISKGRRMLP